MTARRARRWLLLSLSLSPLPGGAACSAAPEQLRDVHQPDGQPRDVTGPPRDRDPQSTYEPRSAPGAGQQFLARMAGDWEVAKTFHPRNGGAPDTTRGSCRQTMIHGGRFLQCEFVFAADGGQSTGTGVIGFEPQTGRFTSFWIDSRSTRVSVRQSEDAFDGEQIVLWSRALGDDGNARRSRTVTRIDADGQRVQHRQWSIAADGSERLVMELVLTRRPAGR